MSIAAQQRKAASELPKYDPSYGWAAVHQPKTLDSVEDYIAMAEQNLPFLQQEIGLFLQSLPFEADLIGPCVKGSKRANQKLFDTNSTAAGHPGHIRDYLRLTISPRTVAELQQTIEKLEKHPMTIGWKNRFYRPEPSTGMRDYKAIWCVGSPEDDMSILAEIKVDFAAMEPAYKFTESMRESERKLADFKENALTVCCSTKDDPASQKRIRIMQADAGETASLYRKLRKDVHDLAAHNLGLNALLDPALAHRHAPVEEKEVRSHVQELEHTDFGSRMTKHRRLTSDTIILAAQAKQDQHGLHLH